MQQVLTELLLKAVKPPPAGRLELADTRCSGLAYRVTAAGARSWCFRFRDPVTGKTTRATLGQYPALGLADARHAAETMRKSVARGINPVSARRQARAEVDTKTFRALATRYLAEHARRHKRSAGEDERNLRLHVLPAWADRAYEGIGRRDVIALVEALVTAGKPALANKVQALVSSIHSFAIDADLVGANPAARLRKRGVETRKTRVLSDNEIRLFWRCCVLPPVSRPVGLALRLALLSSMRASEVAGLRLAEIECLADIDRAAILIPGTRTKNAREFFIPLSALAVEMLREALTLAADDCYAFGVEGHALAVAMRRMADKLSEEPGADTWRADRPTPHDLRRTCATRLAALGIPAEDVSAVLNHVRADVT